ncbi:MAG: OB-fold nucleic acid binding domain-containing protein, partial [Candidatus Thermoplasmatota archaeon]
ISVLGEEYNFRHVRVVGKVTDIPRYYFDKYGGGTLKFYLNDTTGEVTVKCESKVLDSLIQNNKIPAFGDLVDLEGTLYAGEEYKIIKIFSDTFLRIKPRTYEELEISAIAGKKTELDFTAGKLVKISGTISSIYRLSFAYIIYVSDELGNEVIAFITSDFAELTGWGELKNLSIGNEVTIRGALKWYSRYSKWEIVPTSSRDIVAKGAPSIIELDYFPTTVGELLSAPERYSSSLIALQNVIVVEEGSYAENYSLELANEVNFRVADSLTGISIKVVVESYAARPLNLTFNDRVSIKGLFLNYENDWVVKVRANTGDKVELFEGGEK